MIKNASNVRVEQEGSDVKVDSLSLLKQEVTKNKHNKDSLTIKNKN